MTAIQHFTSSTTPSITNAYSGAGAISIATPNLGAFTGMHISALTIQVDTIAASASSLVFKITKDSAGDEVIVPESNAKITLGQTTTTKGASISLLNFLMSRIGTTPLALSSGTLTIYLWIKTNTTDGTNTVSGSGTCNLTKAYLSFETFV